MIDLTRALARFRAFPDDISLALERDKPFAGVSPILELLDGHMVAGSRPVRPVKSARGMLTICSEQ